MSKAKKCILFGLITLIVLTIFGFSFASDLWQQQSVIQNRYKAKVLDSQWVLDDDEGFLSKSHITIHRTFYPEEIVKMLQEEGDEFSDPQNCQPTLAFMTTNQNVNVYVEAEENSLKDKKLVYSFGNNGNAYVGSESGNAFHFVNIPNTGEKIVTVTLELTPSFSSDSLKFMKLFYSAKRSYIPKIYFGNRTVCMNTILNASMLQLLPIGIMFCLAVIALAMYLHTVVIRKKPVKEYHYWGLLALICSMGFFCESQFSVLVIQNSFAVYFISAVCLSLHPRIFTHYLQEASPTLGNKIVSEIFCHLSPINVVLACIFAVVRIVPFSIIKDITEVVLFLYAVYILLSIIHQKYSVNSKLSLFEIALLICIFTIVLDTIFLFLRGTLENPFTYRADLFFFTRIGVLIFLIITANIVFNEVYESAQLTTRANMIQQFTYKDLATGCLNTIALGRDASKMLMNKQNYQLAVITIENIKELIKTPDDIQTKLIARSIAQILTTVLSKRSINVYAATTSKFCLLLTDSQAAEFNAIKNEIQEGIKEFNGRNIMQKIQISYRLGSFNSEKDFLAEDVYARVVQMPSISDEN